MPERPFIPPTRKPVSEFPTPDPSVAFYTELVNRDDPAYIANSPVKRGALYSTMVGAKREVIATYPNLFFLRERKFQLDDQKVLWDWATDEQAHDSYNAEVNYIANAVNYPAFTRTYTIRRELWEADPTVPIGSPLPGIVSVEITSPGQNHTTARGVIDGTSAAVEFVVSPEGGLINGIITNTGEEIIQDNTPLTIIGDGQDSAAIARAQPVGCVLTSQKKEELPEDSPLSHELVRVTRVYETLPGPWIYSKRIDKDGAIVTAKTRRQVRHFITNEDVILDNVWSQTSSKGSDNFVAEETVETRPLPGNPIITTRVEEDGMVTTITKILVDASLVVSGETLIGGVWTKTKKEELASTTFVKDTSASEKVCWQVSESRPIPGNPLEDTRVEEDGMVTTIRKTLSDASTITSGEVIFGGLWTRTHAEEVSDLVAYSVVESRPIPGNAIKSTRLDEDGVEVDVTRVLREASLITTQEKLTDINAVSSIWIREHAEAVSDLVSWDITEERGIPGNPIPDSDLDKDGVAIDIVRTMKAAGAIVTSETLSGGIWVRTEADPITELVSWEKITAREVPGNPIPSANVDQDHEVSSVSTVIRDATTITPSASEFGGIITTVEQREVTDLVSEEVTTNKEFLDTAFYSISIENLIPREFMAFIPTFVEGHVLAGTASQPTLGLGEFEVSERQLTRLLYERRVTSLGSISLPIVHTNQETSESYGGAVLFDILVLELEAANPADQGIDVVSSKVTVLGNGMQVRETLGNPIPPWPVTVGTHIDETYLLQVDFAKQVVAAGTLGHVGVDGTIYEVKPIDKWRSIEIASKFNADTLPADVTWFSGQNHSFPPELLNAVIDWAEAVCGCSESFSAVLIANFDQYSGPVKTRVTEQFYNGVPPDDVVITQFCPQSHNFGFAWWSACGDSDGSCRTKTGAPNFHIPLCLHSDLTLSIGLNTWIFPATSPSNLPHGSYIMLPPHVERWRFGVFRRVLTEVLVPICEGGVGSVVMEADGESADAYLQQDLGADYTNVWVTFDLGFFSAALFAWDTSGSGDFLRVLSAGGADNIAAIYEVNDFGSGFSWNLHGGGSTSLTQGPPPPTGDAWQTCEMHIKVNGSTTAWFYVNGSLVAAFTDPEAVGIRVIRLGLYGTSVHVSNAKSYFRNVKVGTTRGGIEIFQDDFASGDFSKWDSTTGACSLVQSPF